MFLTIFKKFCLFLSVSASLLIFGSSTSHAQAVTCTGSYDPTTSSGVYYDPSSGTNGKCTIGDRGGPDGGINIIATPAINGGKAYSVVIQTAADYIYAIEHGETGTIELSRDHKCSFGSFDDICGDINLVFNKTTNATIEFPSDTGNARIELVVTRSDGAITINSARAYIVNESAPTPAPISNFLTAKVDSYYTRPNSENYIEIDISFSQPVIGFGIGRERSSYKISLTSEDGLSDNAIIMTVAENTGSVASDTNPYLTLTKIPTSLLQMQR